MSISVFLVDDHPIVREGLRAILEQESGLHIAGEAGDGLAAIEGVRRTSPDVVVMDVAMPGMNGIEATRRIRDASPRVKVVALSAYSDKRVVLEMLEAGARGFVLKSGIAVELHEAIRAVAAGESYLSPRVAGSVIESYVGRLFPADDSVHSVLGSREREVVQLLAEGHTSKEIACRLKISVKTVEAHRRNIMRKLDLHSIAALTKFAVREGLTSLES